MSDYHGRMIKLKSLASSIQSVVNNKGWVEYNGERGVAVELYPTRNANIASLSDNVESMIANLHNVKYAQSDEDTSCN